MRHTSTEQAEALYFADVLDNFYSGISRCDATGAAAALRRLHDRNLELEAAQAQRAPLSNQDAETLVRDCDYDPVRIVRATEAKHGITQEKQG